MNEPPFRMPRVYSDDELMGELHRVTVLLGRLPTNDELDKFSRFSLSTYLRRFGNRRAIKQACLDYVRRDKSFSCCYCP